MSGPIGELPDWTLATRVTEDLMKAINDRTNWALMQIRDAELRIHNLNPAAAMDLLRDARQHLNVVRKATEAKAYRFPTG